MGQHIEDYALIGDLNTAALISSSGSVDWLCLPRFDSPAMFAALLGDANHGQWILRPTDGYCRRRRYRPGTLVLETDWVTASGSARVIDFMPVGSSPSRLIRLVRGLTGRVAMQTSVDARAEYGHDRAQANGPGRHVRVLCGNESIWLHSGVPLDAREGRCEAQFSVAASETVAFTLTAAEPDDCVQYRDPWDWCSATERFWTDWLGNCTYQGLWAGPVKQSLILLKALTHASTGGMVAAATASLPEHIGGSRNWDYRFCWLRDATFAVEAFLMAGYTDEARAWRDWLVAATADTLDDIPIMFSVDGTPCPPEQILEWLPGHDGSRPVRIGNRAAGQRQNDVCGEVLATLGAIEAAGVPRAPGQARLEEALLNQVRRNWSRPDHGLWEVRGPLRHFVHSKVMCWAGVHQTIRNLERSSTPSTTRVARPSPATTNHSRRRKRWRLRPLAGFLHSSLRLISVGRRAASLAPLWVCAMERPTDGRHR